MTCRLDDSLHRFALVMWFIVFKVVSQVAANPGYDLDLGMCDIFAIKCVN